MTFNFNSLNYIRGLAQSLINITKGSSYLNKSGETVALSDKEQVANSKRETRDACQIYMREGVATSRNALSKYKNTNEPLTFTPQEWHDLAITLSDQTRFIVTQLSATARAGIISEGIILLTFDEIVRIKSDKKD